MRRDAPEGRPPLVVALDGRSHLDKDVLGSKAWGVNRMAALGLPVPPAFAVTTHACRAFFAQGHVLDDSLWAHVVAQVHALEARSGRQFGAQHRPLLVSVRSGAAHSMPGMMDTVLDLGINDAVEASLAREHANPAHARDTRSRFVEQYRKVVLAGRLDAVPEDPWVQLRAAVAAVFGSWHSPRAQAYRRRRGLSDDDGTAVTIQAMVFGNADARSGTGVLFSRSPIDGEPPAWGEWLPGAQGEDVVSGARTPLPVKALRRQMPDVFTQLMAAAATLERDARDIQDIEYTVESGRLWLLQTRTAKRSPQAAVRAAVAFVEEGLVSREEAVRRLTAEQVRQLPSLQLLPSAEARSPDASGEPACPGVATGLVVMDPAEAEARAHRGEATILARPNTSPEDLPGILAAAGLMTEEGGSTSHAAVVCRELGRPCVVGCGPGSLGSLVGTQVTLDGATGRIWRGDLAVDRSDEGSSADVRTLIQWGLPLVSVQLLRPQEAPPETVDLDPLNDGWRAALRPGIVLRGTVLETDEAVHAAVAAGVQGLVVRHRLPALLACLALGTAAPGALPSPQEHLPLGGDDAEFTLLRLIALKGRPGLAMLAEALALPAPSVAAHCAVLFDQGLCSDPARPLRLTPGGRERLQRLLATERGRLDPSAIRSLYDEFLPLNTAIKRIMTAWQVKQDGLRNDHGDAGYDAQVLEDLARTHAQSKGLMQRLAALAPRLAHYGMRLERAPARVAAGDHSHVAGVLADSYHTVWFELHEELIGLLGLTRAELVQRGDPDVA